MPLNNLDKATQNLVTAKNEFSPSVSKCVIDAVSKGNIKAVETVAGSIAIAHPSLTALELLRSIVQELSSKGRR